MEQQGEAVKLQAIVDADTKRADEVAAEYGVRAFGSIEQMISTRWEIQAASVAVPTVRHLEVGRRLMEAELSRGRTKDARAIADQYVARYPKGPHADAARRVQKAASEAPSR